MEKYLKTCCRTGLKIVSYCKDAIEEVNDGSERGSLVLSAIESVYSYQRFLYSLKMRYPSYFVEGSSVLGLYVKVTCYDPGVHLRFKISRRCNTSGSFDELPF